MELENSWVYKKSYFDTAWTKRLMRTVNQSSKNTKQHCFVAAVTSKPRCCDVVRFLDYFAVQNIIYDPILVWKLHSLVKILFMAVYMVLGLFLLVPACVLSIEQNEIGINIDSAGNNEAS